MLQSQGRDSFEESLQRLVTVLIAQRESSVMHRHHAMGAEVEKRP